MIALEGPDVEFTLFRGSTDELKEVVGEPACLLTACPASFHPAGEKYVVLVVLVHCDRCYPSCLCCLRYLRPSQRMKPTKRSLHTGMIAVYNVI